MRLSDMAALAGLALLIGAFGQARDGGGISAPIGSPERAAAVAKLARDNGFPEATIATAVAKSGCESGMGADPIGDGQLVDAKWGPSIGVWQIRSTWEDTFTFGQRSAVLLLSPSYNAKVARELSGDGRDWHLWSC